ncbi:MAG: sigma-70 family RNA polymerase sigma factor [Lentisphaerae bacterium]|nr:sigma-70 family RNA polymerase sigma factor [Lentisphaerota bacterium]MBT4820114.1 sigma-70 family RNA polymerase sigma factor [Lentisphaerota bacterium]MBT5610560.1 sigma-70 family RNA polymerase sigma factor [Lentisphaerota bacterium]MBT7054432.1 sigma-70 family RNA polymerase sigma factor [Lentisphaerota bacterium]MBT7842601.1 sigma-70 family RNA polymerase sigma factor [Lentisphaerota bacterium]
MVTAQQVSESDTATLNIALHLRSNGHGMVLAPENSKNDLEAARQGDVEAFAKVFESVRPMIHRVAYRMVGANDCDDVVMDTYLKAWRGLARFRGGSSISTWLCRITRNCALDALRSRSRQQERYVSSESPDMTPVVENLPDRHEPSPAASAAARDLGRQLNGALAKLSEEHRRAVLLREVDGLSYRELAAAEGVQVGTIMSRLFYARRRLRKILEASDEW